MITILIKKKSQEGEEKELYSQKPGLAIKKKEAITEEKSSMLRPSLVSPPPQRVMKKATRVTTSQIAIISACYTSKVIGRAKQTNGQTNGETSAIAVARRRNKLTPAEIKSSTNRVNAA